MRDRKFLAKAGREQSEKTLGCATSARPFVSAFRRSLPNVCDICALF